MRATLHITGGAYTGRKISLRDGEIAQFGRTEWADYSFPADISMADRHFRVQCSARQCVVHDLQSRTGTVVDGREVSQAVLSTGNVITAGQTTFLVVLGDDPVPGARPVETLNTEKTATATTNVAPPPVVDLVALGKVAKLSKPAVALVKDAAGLPEAVAKLLEQQWVDDAFALSAAALPPAVAVAWALSNLETTLSDAKIVLDDDNQAALTLVRKWQAEPSDDTAAACETAANDLELATPAAWAARSAYFAQGNLAPKGANPIAVPAGVCGTAARMVLLMASAMLPPAKISAARRAFISDALARYLQPTT